MAKPDPLELAARFVAALHEATRGRSGRFRRINAKSAVAMAEGHVWEVHRPGVLERGGTAKAARP
jgi:hypothetical protein